VAGREGCICDGSWEDQAVSAVLVGAKELRAAICDLRVASNGYFQLLILFIAFVFNHSTQNTMSRLLKLFSIYSPCFLTCYLRRHRQTATCHKKEKRLKGQRQDTSSRRKRRTAGSMLPVFADEFD
jgi:hypothetical protein